MFWRFDYGFFGYRKEPGIAKRLSGIAGMALSNGRPDRIRELKSVRA
ncbi:MAG: hypothetical protein QME41_04785 [Actinomycetota bacterium]|nr:hypothetical protein [Actinomycetota bacterium]